MRRGGCASRLAAAGVATGIVAACGSNEPASLFAPTEPTGRLFEPARR